MSSDLERIVERLREVAPATNVPAARRPGEPGESRYQRLSARLRDRFSSGVVAEAATDEEVEELDHPEVTVDLRREPPDGDSLYQRRSAGLPRSEDVLPS